MQPFTDSTALLDDAPALRERFAEDGYVFVKGAVDIEVLAEVRADVIGVMLDAGWIDPGRPSDAIPVGDWVCIEGEEKYFEVYDAVQRLESFHSVPHHGSVRRVMEALLGETAFPHPLSIARLMFPADGEWITPVHQDYPNNQGTADLYACWMPLGPCPVALGSLSILRGSHRLGVLPLEFAVGAGNRRAVLDERCDELEWVGGDFDTGDAVVFHSLTLHQSLPNLTDRMRLSIDYRFQREGEPLTEGCLEPHFQRVSWPEVYANWRSTDLQYYWRDRDFQIVPWDDDMHALPDDALKGAIRDFVLWRRAHPDRDAPPLDLSQLLEAGQESTRD